MHIAYACVVIYVYVRRDELNVFPFSIADKPTPKPFNMLPVKTRVLEVVCVDPLLLEVGIMSLPGLQPQDFLPADEAGYTGRHAPGLEGVVARNVVLV